MIAVFQRRIGARLVILAAMETLLVVCAVWAGAGLRLGAEAWDVVGHGPGLVNVVLVTVVCQVCFYYTDLYDRCVLGDRHELFVRVLQALGAASACLAAAYYWFPALIVGRGVFGLAAVFVVMAVIGWRVAFDWVS